MKCPFCNAETTKVVDSRPSEDNSAIRRRRQCEICSKRFTTYEKLETFPLMVVKKDESREPYDREKLSSGVYSACHKRPVSAEEMTQLIDEVENAIFSMDAREIQSSTIGELVMEKIKLLDEVAYVRFASVYREFTDVNTFAAELTELLKKKKERH